MLARFKTNADSVGALYYLAYSNGVIDNTATACAILKGIKERAVLTGYAEPVVNFAESCP
jgi:hypothetical protein